MGATWPEAGVGVLDPLTPLRPLPLVLRGHARTLNLHSTG